MNLNSWGKLVPSHDKNAKEIITNPGSLTAYLQNHFPNFSLQVLEECDGLAQTDEYSLLSLDPNGVVKIRTVYLCSQGQPLVYARTIIPHAAWFNEKTKLYQLGGASLGNVLFNKEHPSIRHPFQYALLNKQYFSNFSSIPKDDFFQVGVLSARRSVFLCDDQQLLVIEVFHPHFINPMA